MTMEFALRRLSVLPRFINQIQYSTYASKATIHLSKNDVMVDEKVQINVKGLGKGQKVTLQSFLIDSGKLFAACGHYEADEAGQVNTFQHSSHGGTFQGKEPMGLFWSMKSQNIKRPKRIMKEDITSPFDVRIAVLDGFVNFKELPWSCDSPCLSDCILQRNYIGSGVRRIPVRENGLYGTLFLPPGKGPFPAVIDMFGLTGGILEFRSPLLASHGIAGFSLGYVNFEDLPKRETELDYNYFTRAFDWLASHPEIDENAMGGISTCVGGGYLGVVAMKRPSFKCLVSINSAYNPIGTDQVIEGELIKSDSFKFQRITASHEGAVFKTMFSKDDDNFISPIWRNGAKVLQIHCLDDQCVNPDIGNIFSDTIPHEFRDNFTLIEYPGAGHLLEPPFMPLCRASYNKIFRNYLDWGGEPKAHADAQEDSWTKILDFLHTHLQK